MIVDFLLKSNRFCFECPLFRFLKKKDILEKKTSTLKEEMIQNLLKIDILLKMDQYNLKERDVCLNDLKIKNEKLSSTLKILKEMKVRNYKKIYELKGLSCFGLDLGFSFINVCSVLFLTIITLIIALGLYCGFNTKCYYYSFCLKIDNSLYCEDNSNNIINFACNTTILSKCSEFLCKSNSTMKFNAQNDFCQKLCDGYIGTVLSIIIGIFGLGLMLCAVTKFIDFCSF